MRAIPIELDRPRRLRFSINTARLATSTLQAYLPQKREEMFGLNEAARLIAQKDPHAIVVFLSMGLSHEDRNMSQQKVEDMLDVQFDKGKRWADYVIPLLDALEAAGVVELNRKQLNELMEGNGNPPAQGAEAP